MLCSSRGHVLILFLFRKKETLILNRIVFITFLYSNERYFYEIAMLIAGKYNFYNTLLFVLYVFLLLDDHGSGREIEAGVHLSG